MIIKKYIIVEIQNNLVIDSATLCTNNYGNLNQLNIEIVTTKILTNSFKYISGHDLFYNYQYDTYIFETETSAMYQLELLLMRNTLVDYTILPKYFLLTDKKEIRAYKIKSIL